MLHIHPTAVEQRSFNQLISMLLPKEQLRAKLSIWSTIYTIHFNIAWTIYRGNLTVSVNGGVQYYDGLKLCLIDLFVNIFWLAT